MLTALVFWQTVHCLLGPAPGLPVTGVLSSALEQLAFNWVYQNARCARSLPSPPLGMRGSQNDRARGVCGIRAPHGRWSHSYQGMELPGVAEARRQVAEHVTDSLGLLSWRRFPVITARFVSELEVRVKAESTLSRAEVVALCQALHRLHIGLSGQVQASLTSLQRSASPALSYESLC